MHTKLIYCIIILLYSLVLLSFEVLDEDENKRIVSNEAAQMKLKPLLILGLDESKGNDYLFYKPRDVVEDKMNNIYVLDSVNFRVLKYTKKGDLISTFGNKGQGPGEFISTTGMDIDSEGNIYVNESVSRRLQIFSNDGEFKKLIRMENRMLVFSLLSGGNFVAWYGFTRRYVENTPPLLGIYNDKGGLTSTFGESTDFMNPSADFDGNLIFLAVSGRNEIFVSFCRQNRIEKYSSNGELLFSTKRKLNFDPQPVKDGVMQFDNQVVTKYKIPLVSSDIGVDHKNRIWIATYTKQPKNHMKFNEYMHFEIFDEDGKLIDNIPVPEKFDSFSIFQNNIYLIDTYENMIVHKFEIVN